LVKVHFEHEAVMVCDLPLKRVDQGGWWGLEASLCEVHQFLGIAFAGDQRPKDGSAARPQNVGNDLGQLQVRVFQGLLDPLSMTVDLAGELFSTAGEVA
jgi:hypothetical protein